MKRELYRSIQGWLRYCQFSQVDGDQYFFEHCICPARCGYEYPSRRTCGLSQRITDRGERVLRRGAVRATRLRHAGAAAAARAAELGGRRANQLDRVEAACQIRRDANHDARFPVAVDADNRNDSGAGKAGIEVGVTPDL